MRTTTVFPNITWEDYDYAKLLMRLDLFEDMIVASKFERSRSREKGDHVGQVSTFVVDPLDLASALAGLDLSTGLLPRNCLWWSRRDGRERLAVYIEPRVWELRVMPTEKPNRRVPLPGMVFVGSGQRYSIYAVKETPALTTPLFACPAPNVDYSPRGACGGEVDFPLAGASTIWPAVEAFFGSGFSNHLENGKSQKYPDGVLKLWKELHQAGAEEYPLDDLVELKITLKEVLNGRI